MLAVIASVSKICTVTSILRGPVQPEPQQLLSCGDPEHIRETCETHIQYLEICTLKRPKRPEADTLHLGS